MYRLLTHMACSHLERQVPDPALRARLRPRYPIGCKRILIASDFYPALGRPNVSVVSHAASGFTASGIVGADGNVREVEAIVCATGFETVDPLARLPVRGTGGQSLAAAWRDGPEAYHGITVAGFPNLFMMLGPNTGTGHTSVLIPIEAQARYALACIREVERRGARSLDVRVNVMRRHNDALQERLARTVWASPACTSWYKNAAGKILATYPGYITRYVLETRRPRFTDYVFEPAAAPFELVISAVSIQLSVATATMASTPFRTRAEMRATNGSSTASVADAQLTSALGVNFNATEGAAFSGTVAGR